MKIKKTVCVLLISVICISALMPAASAKAMLGDIDGDNKITSADARLALRAAVNLEALTTEQRQAADYDSDGKITSSDARLILRFAVGLGAEDDSKTAVFERNLYNLSHSFLGKTFDYPIQKWCCMYTMIHVLRPALKNSGYSSAVIDQIAPAQASPSALALYYHQHPAYCTVYTFMDYCNEWLYYENYFASDKSASIVRKSSNCSSYTPKVGDIVIMVNKERSKMTVNDIVYPTLDHTAQIIKVYSDGTFLCTEGSITTQLANGDSRGYVVERVYKFNDELGTYLYVNNDIVKVLDIIRPNY